MCGKKTPVGVRRGGILVHFWCIFSGIEKTYKIENQYLVGFILRREGDSNPRYVFAYMRFPGAPLKPLEHLSFLFYHDKIGHHIVTDKQCLSC